MTRLTALLALLLATPLQAHSSGTFDIDAYLSMKGVSEISVSPDGAFVAYTISETDLEEDSYTSVVWMLPVAGGEPIPMTAAGTSSSTPKWSPDNRYLAILSSRKDDTTQVWLLDRRGGDARQLTEFKQGVNSYDWSPDGKQMLLMADTANHYVWSLGYPDWEVRFDMDKAAAAATRRKIFGMLASDGVPVIGYHMPFPAAGYVETRDDGFRYVPVSYQFMN